MKIYLTNGSEDAFYTAVFFAFQQPDSLIYSATIQLPIGAETIYISLDQEKSARVKSKLKCYAPRAISDVSLLMKRDNPEKENVALSYIRLIIEKKSDVRDMLSAPAVITTMSEIKKVTLEAHRFTGFIRFSESSNGIFYAPFCPDNNILDLILPHFLRRLKNQPFIIHDTKRNIAALYNTKDCIITSTAEKVTIDLSEKETAFTKLWCEYYNSVNIAERPHEKQMKGYMPVRYWKYLPEKNHRIFAEHEQKSDD